VVELEPLLLRRQPSQLQASLNSLVRLACQLRVLEKYLVAYLRRGQSELALAVDLAGVVGNVDLVDPVDNHKEGKAQEDSHYLVQVVDTSLVEHHKAYQGNQDQEGHLDPNFLVEEDRMEDTQGVVRREGQEEDHVAGVGVGVEVEGQEQMVVVQMVFDFDVEELVLVCLG